MVLLKSARASQGLMSGSEQVRAMSALPPKADISEPHQTLSRLMDALPAIRLARRISRRAPAIPQPVMIANAVLGSILLSRHGPDCKTTLSHNKPAATAKILA